MNVVGIDASTHALDYVKLDWESDRSEWTRIDATPHVRAWDRVQSYRESARHNHHSNPMRGSYWDDVILAAVEQPMGRGDSPLIISIAVGIAVAHIPPRIPVLKLSPVEWRRACGLPGNASKGLVESWVEGKRIRAIREPWGSKWVYDPDKVPDWPQDALDAYAIAWAARKLNEQQEAA